MIREPSIFFFIITIDNKNKSNIPKVIAIPRIDLLYILAPIETHIIIPGILEKQYIKKVHFAFNGVKPAAYIKTSFGTNGRLQKINKEIKPVLVSKKDTILSSFSFLINLLTKL